MNILHTSVLINGPGELVDGRRELEALVKDAALALQAHVLRPLDKARHVLGRLNIVSNAEVLRATLVKRYLALLLRRLLLCGRSRGSSLRTLRHCSLPDRLHTSEVFF